MSEWDEAARILPGGAVHDGVRELLDEYGNEAVELDSALRRTGDHQISSRLIVIAEALSMAVARREAARILREETG